MGLLGNSGGKHLHGQNKQNNEAKSNTEKSPGKTVHVENEKFNHESPKQEEQNEISTPEANSGDTLSDEKNEKGAVKDRAHSRPKKEALRDDEVVDTIFTERYLDNQLKPALALRLAVAVAFFIAGCLSALPSYLQIIFCAVSYIVAGGDEVIAGVKRAVKFKTLNDSVVMGLAGIVAFCIGRAAEGAAVMLIFRIGELLQGFIVRKTYKKIVSDIEIIPELVSIKAHNGDVIKIKPANVQKGQLMFVRAGDIIPLDGVVTDGNSAVGAAPYSGKQAGPVKVAPGAEVKAGSVNISNDLTIRVTRLYSESNFAKVNAMLVDTTTQTSAKQRRLSIFCRWYIFIALCISVIVGIILPLIFSLEFADMLKRAMVFFTLACPSAYIVSIPISYFTGIVKAAENGMIVKKSDTIDRLKKVRELAINQEGLITSGQVRAASVQTVDGVSIGELLEMAAYGGAFSSNKRIKKLLTEDRHPDLGRVANYKEIPGEGVAVMLNNKQVILVGNLDFMVKLRVGAPLNETGLYSVYVAAGRRYAGCITFEEVAKGGTDRAMQRLQELGIERFTILSRGNEASAKKIAGKLGINRVYGDCTPEAMCDRVQDLMKTKGQDGLLAYVSRSEDDKAAMESADLGIAMGGLDGCGDIADAVVMGSSLEDLAEGMQSAKDARKVASRNAVFAAVIKLVLMSLGFAGVVAIWVAAIADVIIGVLSVLDSYYNLMAATDDN